MDTKQNYVHVWKVVHGYEASCNAVNFGRVFSGKEIDAIRAFVKGADHYLTWDNDWKPFLAKL